MSDYLWDKSGEPDPEIQHLERLLSPFAHEPQRSLQLRPRKRTWIPLAVAASLAIGISAAWLTYRQTRPAWEVSAIVEGKVNTSRLANNQSINTGGSKAKLEMSDVGEVELEPRTQVKVVAIRPEEQRLELQRGTLHAQIWAPPGRFYVNTKSSVAVDLGCAYTLTVDEGGTGLVEVTAGWVAFEDHGREAFIPAGAACATTPNEGPGIPYYLDAPDALRRGIDRSDIPAILTASRSKDAFTVWHVLRRVPASQRGVVFDRLAGLVHVPASVTREGIAQGDPRMIDALWDTLDLGNTSWWRLWKSRGPQ